MGSGLSLHGEWLRGRGSNDGCTLAIFAHSLVKVKISKCLLMHVKGDRKCSVSRLKNSRVRITLS